MYKDKHPVLVDGNSYDMFVEDRFLSHINGLKTSNRSEFTGDEIFAAFGTPRLMESLKMSALSPETRENILLLSRSAELACTASINMSVIKAFHLQGCKVQIWAYGKNPLFRTYQNLFEEAGAKLVVGMDEVCNAIRSLKQDILNKKNTNQLIVLQGMERICMDFEFIDNPTNITTPQKSISDIRKEYEKKGAIVVSEDDKKKQEYGQAWVRKKMQLKKELKAAGLSGDELQDSLMKEELKFRKEKGMLEVFERIAKQDEKKEEPAVLQKNDLLTSENTTKTGAYNALEDFSYIVKQGSRLGYHFLMNLNSVADVKLCGLKIDLFRYKMAFQLSVDDSRQVFNNRIASVLPEHICQFDDTLERYSFRPYLHKGIGWEGWFIDDNDKVVSPYENIIE